MEVEQSKINNKVVINLISILSFILILLCLSIVIKTSTAQNYEISIYEEYPWYFWDFIILAIFCGQLNLVGYAFSNNNFKYSWLPGLIVIFLANILLLFIPLIRGYIIYGSGDVLTHVGIMRDIIRTGHIGSDMYPILHLIGVSALMLGNISLNDFSLIYPQISSLLFILFSYLLLRSVFRRQSQVLLGLAFSSILIWGNGNMSLSPNSEAFLLLPLLVYLFIKRGKINNEINYSILSVIFIFLIIFYHPLVALLLSIVYIVLNCSRYISIMDENNGSVIYSKNRPHIRTSIYMIFIIVIALLTWESYANIILKSFNRIYLWLYGDAANTNFMYYFNYIIIVNPPILYLIKSGFYLFGVFVITTILSFICIGFLLKHQKDHRIALGFDQIFPCLAFVVFLILSIIALFTPTGFGFGRIYSWAIFFSIIIIPAATIGISNDSATIIIQKGKNHLKFVMVLLVLIILLYISVFSLYLSPIVKSQGQHVTGTELRGMDFFFNKRNEDVLILEQAISQKRFFQALYGASIETKNIFDAGDKIYSKLLILPDHFNYQINNSLSNYYDGPRYLLLPLAGRIFYPKTYPEFRDYWRYTERDFFSLENDTSVLKFYTNKDIDIYFLN